MADRLMPNPEPRLPRAVPSTGGFDELLARLLQRAPNGMAGAIGPIFMAPPNEPDEDDLVDDDLDDEDGEDDLDDEDDEDFDDEDDEGEDDEEEDEEDA